MSKPDLFIVGAPKSGTSAMNHFLGQHPDIFMAKKEIHFFGSDLGYNQPKLTEEEYLRFFEGGKDKKIRGEASVWYLYSKEGAEEIKQFNPEARIIILLRNPIEMMPALHSQNIIDFSETEKDFEHALKLIDARKKGQSLPPRLEHIACVLYTDAVKYTAQVKRYLDAFGDTEVRVILYDDFKKDNLGIYRATLRFLGVDDTFVPEIATVNPNKKIKSRATHELVKEPSPLLRKTVKALLPSQKVRHAIKKKIMDWNLQEEERETISHSLKKKLQEECEADIRELGALLKRDLSSWLH